MAVPNSFTPCQTCGGSEADCCDRAAERNTVTVTLVMDIHLNARILHALTEYDRREHERATNARQKGKPGYHNIWALSQYFRALNNAEEYMRDEGMTLRQALVKSFTGRLLDVVLKAAGEAPSTDREQRF